MIVVALWMLRWVRMRGWVGVLIAGIGMSMARL